MDDRKSHGLAKREGNKALKPELQDLLHAYFLSLEELDAPRATRLVSNLSSDKQMVNIELRNTNIDVVVDTGRKCSLYHGWEVKYDHKSCKTGMKKVEQELMEGEEQNNYPVLSWPMFCLYWQKHFPKLVIQ